VLRVSRFQFIPAGNLHVIVFKARRHCASRKSELSRALVFGRKPVHGLYGHLERLSFVEIGPQLFFTESAMQIEDVDRKRIAFEKVPDF
jgi:hypothetical protein